MYHRKTIMYTYITEPSLENKTLETIKICSAGAYHRKSPLNVNSCVLKIFYIICYPEISTILNLWHRN